MATRPDLITGNLKGSNSSNIACLTPIFLSKKTDGTVLI
jgi:hypothetical protein